MNSEQDKAIERLITELKLEGRSKYTIKNYTKAVYDLFRFTKKSLKGLDEQEVRAYLATLFNNKSTSTISLTASALRYFLSEILDKPIGKIKIPKRENLLPEVLTRDEVDQIISAASTKKSKLIIKLIYSSGLRVSEAASFKIQDINFETGRSRLKGKGNKVRQVLIPPKLLAELKTFK